MGLHLHKKRHHIAGRGRHKAEEEGGSKNIQAISKKTAADGQGGFAARKLQPTIKVDFYVSAVGLLKLLLCDNDVLFHELGNTILCQEEMVLLCRKSNAESIVLSRRKRASCG